MTSSENGNAFFLVFIGIALFAALSYAVSGSGRSGGDISDEKSSILASEMMDYAERLSGAISKLRLSGCSLSQISFENSSVAGYINGSAPTNESCHVFSNQGGGMSWPNLSADTFNAAWVAQTDYGEPIFTIKNEIPQLGTDGDGANSYDLLMIVEAMNSAVCDKINTRANGNTTVNNAADIETKYDGTINTTGAYTFPAAFNGQRQACFNDNSGADSGTLTYYYAVVIR